MKEILLSIKDYASDQLMAEICVVDGTDLISFDQWTLNVSNDAINFDAPKNSINSNHLARIVSIDTDTKLIFLALDGFDGVMKLGNHKNLTAGQYLNVSVNMDAYDDKAARVSFISKYEGDAKPKPKLIKAAPNLLEHVSNLADQNNAQIVCDHLAVHAKLKQFLETKGKSDQLLDAYFVKQDAPSLFEEKGLVEAIDQLFLDEIKLPSGASILFDHTRAMTVIDVNSGQNHQIGNDKFLKINQEAAIAIFKRLKLRYISGLIVVDFLKLSQNDQTKFRGWLKDLAKKHKINMGSFTQFGLVEFRIKRTKARLKREV